MDKRSAKAEDAIIASGERLCTLLENAETRIVTEENFDRMVNIHERLLSAIISNSMKPRP